MINIISRAVVSKRTTGPGKVVKNLIKGLDLLGYPYVVNGDLTSSPQLWIHDDKEALHKSINLPKNYSIIAGPNIFIRHQEIKKDVDLSRIVYLHPSEWVKSFWEESGFNRCSINIWPAGIDITAFPTSENSLRKKVLVYFKQRSKAELETVLQTLRKEDIPYNLIEYGSYKEKGFKKALSESKYAIWIGRQESQGIALQEILASNVPILLWDITHFGQWEADKKQMEKFNEWENNFSKATSAPYFNEQCGIRIIHKEELEDTLSYMEAHWPNYSPREFIKNNLGLKKQAKDLMSIFENNFAIPPQEKYSKTLFTHKKWKNAKIIYQIKVSIKDFLKKFLK